MPNLSLCLIQTNPYWEDVSKNLELFEKKISTLSKGQVVVLPEMFSTGFSMQSEKLAETMEGETVKWMRKMAQRQGIILIGSVIIKEKEHYYNRLLWVLPNGKTAHYDKRHLFSYAQENEHYSPGRKRLIAQVNGWKIGLFICYDLRFPVWLRQQKKQEAHYDLIIVIANWPASRIQAWDTLLSARAIENQCYVAAVNRTGIDGNNIFYNGHSSIFGPKGEKLKQSDADDIILQQVLDKKEVADTRQQFPFLDDADEFNFKN